jgi:hypothetical protein
LGVTALTLIIAATPLAEVWLNNVMALPADLLQLSRTALWIGLFIPFSALLQNWYQGIIVSSRHTHGVTEAVILYICTIGLVLFTGVRIQSVTGLFITITAYELAGLMQAIWLWQRSRPAVNARLASKDVQPSPLNPG